MRAPEEETPFLGIINVLGANATNARWIKEGGGGGEGEAPGATRMNR